MPLYEYFPRIKTYLVQKLGAEFEGLLALPKVFTEKNGARSISWVTTEFSGAPVSLSQWLEQTQAGPASSPASQTIQRLLSLISELESSSNPDDRSWGQLLGLCFSNLNPDHLFVEGDKTVIAAWGLKPLPNTGTSSLSIPFTPKEKSQPQPAPVPEAGAPSGEETLPPQSEEKPAGNEQSAPEEPAVTAPASSLTPPPPRQEAPPSGQQAGPPPAGNPPRGAADSWWKKWWWRLLLLLLLLLLFIFLWKKCEGDGGQTFLPPAPNIIVPIDSASITPDDDSLSMIAADRINVALREQRQDLEAFAKAFKKAYPDPSYEIIYYDTLTKRLQIKVPAEQREEVMKALPDALPDFKMLIWHESIFSHNAMPSDPGFRDQQKTRYLEVIKAFGAWDKTFGDTSVTIAIIDDGFDPAHPEFAGKITKAWNVLDRNQRVFSNARLTHGSHVAGTALANKDNNQGLSGIAPGCRFMPIQVAGANGVISSTAVIDAVLYAINQGADVINLSLGLRILPIIATLPPSIQRGLIANSFLQEEAFWKEVFSMAEENNVSIVIAGGNDNVLIGLDPIQRSDYAIKVSAVGPDLNKASFSNYGEYSTLSAPGVGIFSSVPSGQYAFMDGTSMAAPVVTGAVALLKSARPDLTGREITNLLQNTGLFLSPEIGPLIQLDQALAQINNPGVISDTLDCGAISQKIDSLMQEIERLKGLCPGAGAPDTMKMPEVIEDLDFSIGRWKSTTSIFNDDGDEVTLYFDFFGNQTGKLTLAEPGGTECMADLSLSAGQQSFSADQTRSAACPGGREYERYIFTCQPDQNGYAECIAQNKAVKGNRFPFRLVKIR